MTIKYGLQFFFFFELTDNDGQNFLAGNRHSTVAAVENSDTLTTPNF
jgi:hypothetical protein